MPEETSAPIPTRRRNQPEESGGGGKILSIILIVLVLGLGFALFKRNGSATAQGEKDALTISNLTASINELKTKVVLEQGNAGVSQSNHLAVLDRRTAELVMTSNRLVQTALLLSNAQHQAQSAQMDLQTKAAAHAALEAERDDLLLRLEPIPSLFKEISDLKQRQTQAMFERDQNAEALGRARLEKADLERKLEDPLFLRLQERRVLESAEMRQRAAAGQRIDASDPRVRLELQPDGTVRSTVTASAAPKK
jgi:hypothetical protein